MPVQSSTQRLQEGMPETDGIRSTTAPRQARSLWASQMSFTSSPLHSSDVNRVAEDSFKNPYPMLTSVATSDRNGSV